MAGLSVSWLCDPRACHGESHVWMMPAPFLLLRGWKNANCSWVADWHMPLSQFLKDTGGVDLAQIVPGALPIPVQAWATHNVPNFHGVQNACSLSPSRALN
jgi:hypothetical protein